MRSLIPHRKAVLFSILIFLIVITLHVLILLGIIPYDFVWGGRLNSKAEMIPFELISISINIIILLIVLMQGGILKNPIPKGIMRILLILIAVLFAVNTLGNIASESIVETIIFTPVTVLLTLFFIRMAIEPTKE